MLYMYYLLLFMINLFTISSNEFDFHLFIGRT